MNYKYIVNDKVFHNSEELVGQILVNKKEEKLKIIEVIRDDNSNIKLAIKNKQNLYSLEEEYYLNYRREIDDGFACYDNTVPMNTEIKTIKDIVKQRKIEYLCHFTNIKNLKHILSDGLVTKDKLYRYKSKEINDNERFDFTNALCTSISFPNYKMLYKLKNNNQEIKWVVVFLNVKILWELNCSFFYTNAASSLFKNRCSIVYKKIEAFNDMFCEQYPPNLLFSDEMISRSHLNIPESYTTDPQAEVLVFDDIPVKYISGVVYSNIIDKMKYENDFRQYKHLLNKNFFNGRTDYKYWQKGDY